MKSARPPASVSDATCQFVNVLCESFFDYPVMRFVLGDSSGDYEKRLGTLIHFFVMARAIRREFLIGVGDRANLDGAAIVSCPAGPGSPPQLAELREQLWAELGPSARARYEAFGDACAPFQVETPHLHLNMIGLRRRVRGKGIGGSLLEYVHRLSREDPESEGVTLSTEDKANVSLYEHAGYKIVGHANVTPELETWGFFRPN